MQAMLELLVSLHRHERTVERAARQMSPLERTALDTQLELVRSTIPKYVLDHYDLLKESEPVLDECPAALAMATLVSVYRALPARKRRTLNSFFDVPSRYRGPSLVAQAA